MTERPSPTLPEKSWTPDFFIAGFPKCATTSLAQCLAKHPDISISSIKEPHYFSPDYPFGPKFQDYDEYISLWPDVDRRNKICGEASVFYVISDLAIPSILERNPNAKIIIIVRNPVDAAFSLFNQHLVFGWEVQTDFCKVLRKGDRSPSEFSHLSRDLATKVAKICNYKKIFSIKYHVNKARSLISQKNIYIAHYESLSKDPKNEVKNIVQFLGARPTYVPPMPHANRRKKIPNFLARVLLSRASFKILSAMRQVCDVKGFGMGKPRMTMRPCERKLAEDIFREHIDFLHLRDQS